MRTPRKTQRPKNARRTKRLGPTASLAELVNERIETVRRSKGDVLALDGLHLNALPEAIGKLAGLAHLLLSHNALQGLPDCIDNLRKLSRLDLSNNQVRALPEFIGTLCELADVQLTGNQLTSLPDSFGDLAKLQILSLWGNPLCTVPNSVARLRELRLLDLDNTGLSVLPDFVGQLSELRTLYINNNQLGVLPNSIGSLKKLNTLWLQDNDLSAIPEELTMLAEAGELRELYLHGNDALGIPAEILGPDVGQLVSRENRSLPESKKLKAQKPRRIARYLRQLQAGPTGPLNEAKVLVVGPGGHGKSSLIDYLRDGTFQKGRKTTEGIKVAPWVIPQSDEQPELRLNVWDFGGQEIQHSTHEFFLTQRAVYLLAFQPRDDQATAQGLYYWLDLIHLIAPNAPVIVALTKQDEYEGHVNDAGDLKKLHPKLVEFIPISCDAPHPASKNVPRLRQLVFDTVCGEIGHIRYKLPAAWMRVKGELEKPQVEYLSYTRYQKLCAEAAIVDPEDQKLLATFLNDLGTMLNYADRMPLEDTHILNPAWVTDGVYAVVLATELHAAEGVFDEELLAKLLSDPKHNGKYPRVAQRFILQMMLSFHLCYELAQHGGHRQYLVPNALPASAPTGADAALASPLRFEIQFPRILPTSVISRFIVAMHSTRATDKRWRLGLRSQIEGHEYLVTAHPKEKRIRIAVGGAGAARVRVLEVIRQHFAVICREKEGLGAREVTFPPGHELAEGYPFDSLLEAERNEQSSIWLPGGIGNISVTEWLNGVTDPKARRKIQEAIAEAAKHDGVGGRSGFIYIDKVQHMTGADMSDQEHKAVNVTARDITHSVIGMDQQMQDCFNTIRGAPDSELKKALVELHGHVEKLLTKPEAKDPETVKSDLQAFVKEAVKPAPRRNWLELSGNGLIDAAKTVAVMSGPIIETVHKILEMLPG